MNADTFEQLLTNVVNAAFDCGDDRSDSDEYEEVLERSNVAKQNLRTFVEKQAEEISKLRAAIELGQENCDNAYNDLRDERDNAVLGLEKCVNAHEDLRVERNALLLAVEDHARYYQQADHMSAKDRLKAIHELVAEFLDDAGVPYVPGDAPPAPGEMP